MRKAISLLVALLLVGACSGDGASTTSFAPTTASGPSSSVIVQPSTTTVPPSTTTIPKPAEGGLIGFGQYGVIVVPNGLSGFSLASDRFYEGIAYAIPDSEGGIVYQHVVTPVAWSPGSLLRVHPGLDQPRLVIAGTAGIDLIPRSVIEVRGYPALLYLEWDRSVRAGSARLLTDRGTITIWDAATSEWSVRDASAGGERVLLHLESNGPDYGCRVALVGVSGSGWELHPPGMPDCGDLDSNRSFRLSSDAGEVWYIDGGHSVVVVQDLEDPEARLELPIETPGEMTFDGVDRAVVATLEGPVLVTRRGDELISEPILAMADTLVPYRGVIALSSESRLGIGLEEYPCTSRTPDLPEQELPAEVAATRRRIHEAIVGCDWEALRELATVGDGVSFSVAYGSGNPIPYWIGLMRDGNDILGDIATVLTLPAVDATYGDDFVEGDDTVVWVWPAVGGKRDDERTEADWQALLALYTQEEVDRLRFGPEGYVGGFMVTIRADGIWLGAFILDV